MAESGSSWGNNKCRSRFVGTILDEDEAAEGYTHEEVRDSIRIYSRRWNPQLLGDWGVTVTGGAIQGGAQ